jgi:hypothetical protein
MMATVAMPASAAAQGSVVCAEWDEGTDVCLLELTVDLTGDPPTVVVSVSGSAGGHQVWCDRGSNYNPDPRLAHLRQVPGDPGVIMPDGYRPGDPGAVYSGMCFSTSHPAIELENYCFCVPPRWFGAPHYVFLESQPDGFNGTPDPVPDLLVSAIEEMALQGPTIGTAPPAGQGAGLVRLPVWLWNEVSGSNWGTLTETAGPIAGISVVAQAEATGIDWQMGDGGTVHCGEGVAWHAGMSVFNPPCGYAYARASRHRPGGVYEISATTTWILEWQTEGLPEPRGGEFELQATSTTTLQIDEIQVVTSR